DLGIDGQYGRNNLHIVIKIIRKQRTDGTIDETRSQRLLLGRASFSLEKATRNSACGVCLLDIVDSQREKIAACLRDTIPDSSDQNDGIAHGNTYGSVSLTSQLARLQGDGVSSIRKRLANNAQESILELDLSLYPGARAPQAPE